MTNINQKNSSATSLNSVNSSTIYQSLSVHFEQPVTSVSISPNKQDVVLAAKKGMFILDLEAPYEMPRVLQHITKWEVADVQWNPHIEKQNWIASTSNQKVLIWNLALSSNSTTSSAKHVEMVLTSHTRAVSDINWSVFKPEMLATCSLDSYIHLWDLKSSHKKPVNSFCAWTAGATQVKWNKKNEWLLASSHDSDLRIWDIRKGSTPVTIITAHMNKIYGIDWHNTKESEILTCSQDKLVKFWDINDPKICQGVITTNTPVWRARYTPFGEAVITMPQRNDSQLLMWSCNDLTTPIYSFNGHNDVVREFLWRSKKETLNDTVNYQLITWSKDKTLKLWPISPKHLKIVGNKNSESENFIDEDLILITNDNLLEDSKTSNESSQQPKAQLDTPSQINPNIDSFSSSLSMSFSISETKPPTLPKLNVDSSDIALAVSRNKPLNNISVMKEEDFDGSYFQEDDDIFTGISNEIDKKEQIRESYIPTSLEDEIEWISKRFPSVRFEKVNFTYRTCTITLHHFESYVKPGIPAVFVKVNIQFPPQYPNKAPPTFQIQKTGMISMANRNFMTSKLEEIASTYAEKSLPCLEASIQFLLSGDASSTLKISTENDEITYPRNVSFFDDYSFTNNQDDIDNLSSSSSDNISTIENFNKQSFKKKNTNNDGRFNYSSTQNVPYPCLCGARFSPTGKLVVFFSPLPHPSETKFTTHTLGTHNQQPILQTTQFTTQPKTFDLYDSYRNFILVRYPKVFLTGSGVNQDPLRTEDPLITSNNNINQNTINDKLDDGNDGKLNLWFDMDEEDQEETPMPSLFYKPKPNTTIQPALASTSNFLRRVRQYTKAKPNIGSSYSRSLAPGSLINSILDQKLNSDPIINNESFPIETNSQINTPLSSQNGHHSFLADDIVNQDDEMKNDINNKKSNEKISFENSSDDIIVENDNLSIISQPPSSHETEENDDSESTTPIVMNKRYHGYQYSGGINLSTSKSSNGLVESITHSTLSSYNDSAQTNEEIIREAMDDEMNYNDVPVFTIEDEEKRNENEKSKKEDDSGYFGASIFIKDIQRLLPINKKLAKDYTLHGDDAVVICMKNCRAAKKNNRPDLVKIWGIIGLILSKYRKAIISNNDIHGQQVFEEKTSISWKLHPFGRHLVNTIFSYLEKQGDVQTLALLSCVFTIPYKNENNISNMSDIENRQIQLKSYSNEQSNTTKLRNPLLLNSQLDYEGSYSPLSGNMVDGHPATTFTPSGMMKPKKLPNQINPNQSVQYAILDNGKIPLVNNNRFNQEIPIKYVGWNDNQQMAIEANNMMYQKIIKQKNMTNNQIRPNMVHYINNIDNNQIQRPIVNQNISIINNNNNNNNNYYQVNMPHININQRPYIGKYPINSNESLRRQVYPEDFNYQPPPHPYFIANGMNNINNNMNINNNHMPNIPIPIQVPLPMPMPQPYHSPRKPSISAIEYNNSIIEENDNMIKINGSNINNVNINNNMKSVSHPMKNTNELKNNSIPKESNLSTKPGVFRNPIISTTTNYNNYINRYSPQPSLKIDNNPKDDNSNINDNSSLSTIEMNNIINQNSLTNSYNNSSLMGNMGQIIVQNHNSNEITMTRVQPYGEFDDEEGGDIYVPLIDANKQIIYDRYRIVYAEILYSWGYLEQRAEILKFVTEQHLNVTELPPFELTIKCSHCEKDLIPNNKGFFCMRCNESKRGSICSICRLPVRGLTNFCMICNHGGHMEHIRDWFVKEKNIYCPAGCNCQCVFKNKGLIGIIP